MRTVTKPTSLNENRVNWNIVKLKDIAVKVNKKNKSSLITTVFSNSALNGIVEQKDFFDKDIANKNNLDSYFVVEEDDFVYNPRISTSAPCGPINRNKTNKIGVVSPLYTVFRLNKNKCNLDYFEQYFKSNCWHKYMHSIANYGVRADRMNIKDIDFFNMKIKIPDLPEQNKIASILFTWDKSIELKEKLIEQKKEQKKGLMQKLLTGEVRLPGFDGEWKAEKIKNISKVYRGASPRPISDSRWFDQDSKIGWVRISDVTNSKKILYKTEQYLSEEGIKKSRLVKKNSIIMSICATVGKPIITGFDVCIHDGFVVFEDVKINKDYFYYSLLRIENYWIKYGQTGSQMNLNTDIVGNEKIKFPVEYAEQKAIAELLMNVDKEIDLLESELEQLKLQKQGLMQLLLTGKVRVKV